MHIYAFGSICRGDIDPLSDVDLLVIADATDVRFDVSQYSVYGYERIAGMWNEGNPFAWHLHLESKMIFTGDGRDYLQDRGAPHVYADAVKHCRAFDVIFQSALLALRESRKSAVFELSTMFLAIRNLATCASFRLLEAPVFSRHAALTLGDHSLIVPADVFTTLETSRILSTRGKGCPPSDSAVNAVLQHSGRIENWMAEMVEKVQSDV